MESVTEKGKLITKFEEVFETDVIYFAGKAEFVQRVHLKANAKTKLNGTISYMACNDEQCLPPTETPFQIELL